MADEKADTATHNPDPERWWAHRRFQSYIGILGLLGLSAAAILGDVDEAAGELLGYAGVGCLLLIIQYAGTTAVDALRAWKGN